MKEEEIIDNFKSNMPTHQEYENEVLVKPTQSVYNDGTYCTLFRFGDQEKRCEKQCEGCKRVIQ